MRASFSLASALGLFRLVAGEMPGAVDLVRLDRVRLHHLGVVRLAEADRHVGQQLHLRARDVDQLEVLRMERTDVGVPVDRPLVHGDQVLALRIHRVPLRRREVADVVVDGDLVDELERLVGGMVRSAERPLRDRALEIEARVGVALVVVLRVQRARAELHLAGDDRVELQDRDAVAVLALVVLRLDRFLDQVEAVDGRVRIELARHGDVVTLRRDVDAVRAARLGREVQQAFGDGGLEGDDADAVQLGELARGDDLFRLLPVDDVQVVEVELRGADFQRPACRARFRRSPSRRCTS